MFEHIAGEVELFEMKWQIFELFRHHVTLIKVLTQNRLQNNENNYVFNA